MKRLSTRKSRGESNCDEKFAALKTFAGFQIPEGVVMANCTMLTRFFLFSSVALLVSVRPDDADAGDARDDMLQQVMETMDWAEPLSSYDVELLINESSADKDRYSQGIEIIREVWLGDTDGFVLGKAQGTMQFNTDARNSGQRDLAKETLFYGNEYGVQFEVLNSGYAIGRMRCSPDIGSCRTAARGMDFGKMILKFVIPLHKGPELEFASLMHALSNAEEGDLSITPHEYKDKKGENVKEKIVRICVWSVVQGKPGETVGSITRLVLSDSGFDKGRVISVKRGMLKSTASGYRTEEDVRLMDRSVRILWAEIKRDGNRKSIVVPKEVIKRFGYDEIPYRNPETMRLHARVQFDWKSLNEPIDQEDPKQFMRTTLLENGKRINKMLNR